MLTPQPGLPSSIPAWAKVRIENLKAKGDKLTKDSQQIPDGFVKQGLTDDRAVLRHWQHRRTLGSIKSFDNSSASSGDKNPAKGIVDLGHSEFHLSGNFQEGQLLELSSDKESVNFTVHQGNTTTSVAVNKNGFASYSRTDAENPSSSVAIETDRSRPSHPANRSSKHAVATAKASDLLADSRGESIEEQVASLFFHQRENLPETRQQLMDTMKQGIEQLPAAHRASIQQLLDNPTANTPRKLSQELLRITKESPPNKELSRLRDLSGAWQILEDAPKLMADGLLRTQESYVSPGSLQLQTAAQSWEFDKKTGLPIADTIVVGGGPGGLATGYHLSEQGHRTVIFEGGKIGQAFSDASAQSVHQLRTTTFSTDLIYTNSQADTGIDVSLARNANSIRAKGLDAKKSWNELRGEKDHSSNESFGPVNRNNLFEHMMQIGHGLATKYPDTFLIENSPITSIQKEQRGQETLFRIKSAKGHELLTKTLVMATGFVGSNGEYARGLQQFSDLEKANPESVTTLLSDHDLVSKNDHLLEEKSALVFSDRLLGRPEIRERIKSLPKGSRLAVVGSGESAAKGTIEALALNPELKVDLYTKNPLEPYQVQIPVSHFSTAVTENAIKNKELADQTLDEFKKLKTPITTETMKTLLSLEAEGRLHVREFGKRFDEKSVDVSLNSTSSQFEFSIKDSEVAEVLKEQRDSWIQSGLYGVNVPENSADQLPNADMVMMAVGYDTSRVNASPLMQQLIDQDLVEIHNGRVQYGEDGLTSSLNSNIGFNTAGAVRMSADTALPGRALRALRLVQNFESKLPKRERPKPEDSIARGLESDFNLDTKNERENVVEDLDSVKKRLSFKTNGVRAKHLEFSKNEVEAHEDPEDRAWAQNYLDLTLKFAGPNSTVRTLVGRYQEFPESLTAAEKLTAERARQIAERLEKGE